MSRPPEDRDTRPTPPEGTAPAGAAGGDAPPRSVLPLSDLVETRVSAACHPTPEPTAAAGAASGDAPARSVLPLSDLVETRVSATRPPTPEPGVEPLRATSPYEVASQRAPQAEAPSAEPPRVPSDPRAALLDAPTRAHAPDEATVAASVPDSTGLRRFDVLGAYQILQPLGGGGMAEVYLARATLGAGVEKLVALKTARPLYGPDSRLGALFLNEAKVSATLQHPNVVQVFDFGEAAGRPYLAMEYLHGRELHEVLARVNDGYPLPVDFLVRVLADVCDALEYVHTQRGLDGAPLNLVHRDVSPSNVLITERGEVKLMDFGVAAGQDDQSGLVVGKKAYMPPEQAQGEPPSPRWDVYALGAILGEFLSRSRFGPAPTGGPVEAVADLEEIARRATAEDPRKRYGSAAELGGELRRIALHLDRPDVGGTVRTLFGAALEEERGNVERLVQEGRRRAPRRFASSLPGPLRALSAWRRRVASTRWAMRLAASPRLARGLALGLSALIAVGAYEGVRSRRQEQAVTAELRAADERIAAGRLVGPGGDFALDRLLAARRRVGEDARISRRLLALAATFERLGDAAIQRGDHAEAAVHLQAALQADPGRTTAQEKLAAVETAVREQARQRRARGTQ